MIQSNEMTPSGETRPLEVVREEGFATSVPSNGYHWWYIDALSDDGSHGLTIIVFIGSVFSPYYAAARRRGPADPQNFCAVNVALYNPDGKRWALTERGARNLQRTREWMQIGPSGIRWEGNTVEVSINELTVPLPGRLRGRVRLELPMQSTQDYRIDRHSHHRWWPISPNCRAEVHMQRPDLHWQGHGYFDSNRGSEPLETAFTDWDWSRSSLADGGSLVQYHTRARDTQPEPAQALALRFSAEGGVTELEPLPQMKLPSTTIWRIRRSTQADAGTRPEVKRTFEDTPFYARSWLLNDVLGERADTVHESLCLNRFSQRWVQTLLPFRMPRYTRAVRGGPG
jgi:carotenoid 1,2-hydratase